jgi:hypothetical protein
MTWRLLSIIVASALTTAACRPAGTYQAPKLDTVAHPSGTALPGTIDRGAVLYTAYCAGCHGPTADGRGPVAGMFGLKATDLRAPAAHAASDDELVARVMCGSPLVVPSGRGVSAEELDVDAITRYLPTLATSNRELLRAGRLVFEGGCACSPPTTPSAAPPRPRRWR